MTLSNKGATAPHSGEPVWDIAELFPPQGLWTEEEYLALTDSTNHLLELSDGTIEVLPMPTERHQEILLFLAMAINAIAQQIGGKAFVAPLRLRLSSGRFREPDLMLLRAAADPRRRGAFLEGADLVMEIVSESAEDRRRDLTTKRAEYAQAGIPEYWIIDPFFETVTVLQLRENQYIEFGHFPRQSVAQSPSFPDLRVEVSAIFDAR